MPPENLERYLERYKIILASNSTQATLNSYLVPEFKNLQLPSSIDSYNINCKLSYVWEWDPYGNEIEKINNFKSKNNNQIKVIW